MSTYTLHFITKRTELFKGGDYNFSRFFFFLTEAKDIYSFCMCLGAMMGNMVTYDDLQFSLHISLRIYQIKFNQTSMRFCHMQ